MSEPQPLTKAEALYYDDLKRLRGRRGQLLALLIDQEWHPNHELAAVGGLSFNDSLFAFRQEGWIIESRPTSGGIWEFRLVGKSKPRGEQKQMSRPQSAVAGAYVCAIADTLGYLAAQRVSQALPEWMRSDANAFESSP